MLFEFAQITSAKVCSVFLKYQMPDAMRTTTSTISNREGRPVDAALPAQEAPAETVYDSHHRIERIEEAKPLRNDAALESDRRDIKAELDHERDNETEIAILDHEGGDPQADSRARRRTPSNTKKGRNNTASGGTDGTRSSGQRGRRREIRKSTKLVMTLLTDDDEAREIYFGNQVEFDDEAVAAFGHRGGKKLPGQHAAKNQQRIRHTS